jgi:hypothetical protein
MKNARPAVVILLLLFTLTVTTAAQQKRQTPAKPQPKPAPTPAPTFETLVPADSYIIYGEVRGAGQLIRSSALNDLLEPVLKLSGPPKEFRTVVKWLNAHAEEVMTSRLLLATWPNKKAKDLPEAMIAIEFASAEEATKFTGTLNEFLPTVLPPSVPEPSAEKETPRPETAAKPKPPPAPNFHLKRFGSLVVVTPKAWTMKQLKPAGSKILAEDTNFRAAHNRFSSDPVFVYVDTRTISTEQEENQKRWEQQRIEAQKQAQAEAESKKEEDPPVPEMTDEERAAAQAEELAALQAAPSPEPQKGETVTAFAFSPWSLLSIFGTGETHWPDGLAFALSFEGDSFDLRALLISDAGEKADAVPFMPMLIPGPAFAPEAPNIFPAETELMITMSLDLPQIYAQMMKPLQRGTIVTTRTADGNLEANFESPFAEIEKQLKISIKNDLLPLLGPEIAVRLPMKNTNFIGLPGLSTSAQDGKPLSGKDGLAAAIAIKDKEAIRALMPKLIEALGFKGAGSLAQTERREDTEIVSVANAFSYAFVGNFLILSMDTATTRYAQIYISPALMQGYKEWAESPITRVSEQTRAFLMRASSTAQPITYSLSNEGLGPLHEVHIPKNLVLMVVAGIASESNPPPAIQNERAAIGLMYMIASAEQAYKTKNGNGSCGTLEQLIAADMVSKEVLDKSGYRFEVTVTGDKFEVSAVPVDYGENGKLSLFIDQTMTLRGGDRNGAAATASDPPIN